MKIDFRFLEKNGYLKQEDYDAVTKEWLSLLNPVRIAEIRKYMRFTKLKFEVYEREISKFQQKFDNVEDEVDMLSAPLFFVTTFSSTLFPDFQDEYFAPLSFLTNKNYLTLEGLKVIESSLYHSLTKAQYSLEVTVKERFRKSKRFQEIAEDVAVFPQYLVPFEIDSEFPMTIILNVNLIVK